MRHYLTIRGARGQCAILQARYCPNGFTVEHQARGRVTRHEVYASWKAYALAYTLSHGRAGGKRFLSARVDALGY